MSTAVFELEKGAVKPLRSTEHAAAYDVFCPEDITIAGHSRSKIPLNFRMQFDPDLQALIEPRSGFELKGFEGYILNGVGQEEEARFDCDVLVGKIDADYRGIVSVIVKNSDRAFICKKGTRIAQLTFVKIDHPNIVIGKVDTTERGEGGFGHTGV